MQGKEEMSMKHPIDVERETYIQESPARQLARTASILAKHPLTHGHYDAVVEHLSTLSWSKAQYQAIEKVIILLATGGTPKASDVECLLSREDVETLVERELRKPVNPV